MGKLKNKIKRAFRDKGPRQTKHYSKKTAVSVLSVFAVLSIVLAVIGFIYIKKEFKDTDAFRDLVSRNYFLSVVVLILVCALQVIVALIPGELVEIVSGYAFGAWMGAVYCIIGATLGSVIVILISRKFGRRFVESIYPREKIDALPVLGDPKTRNIMTALLFLIPGTPKDLLTYAIGLTNQSIPMYILLTTFSRLPSVITSTMGGNALGDSEFFLALKIFAFTAAISLAGYLVYLRITNGGKKKNGTDNKDGKEVAHRTEESDNARSSSSCSVEEDNSQTRSACSAASVPAEKDGINSPDNPEGSRTQADASSEKGDDLLRCEDSDKE
ncbi:MAG: TVP38/TMEM64 family protein [Eubacteriales bacterium]